jgi:hypothetical protein
MDKTGKDTILKIEQRRARAREKYLRNPEKQRAWSKRWNTQNRKTQYGKINNRMTVAIWLSFKDSKCGRKWESLVGYGVEELKNHLESHFLPGMSWDNMGEWHIDHIIPKSAFHYETTDDIDFKKCWSLKNLQPLWAKDNLSKNDRTARPHQPSLLIAL